MKIKLNKFIPPCFFLFLFLVGNYIFNHTSAWWGILICLVSIIWCIFFYVKKYGLDKESDEENERIED